MTIIDIYNNFDLYQINPIQKVKPYDNTKLYLEYKINIRTSSGEVK